MATPSSQSAMPEVPLLPCMTCEAPPLTDLPPGSNPNAIVRGDGSVTAGAPVGPGCLSFIITCEAAGMNFVVIGANQQGISLSTPSSGQKMATVVCNGDGQLEGRTVPAGDPVIVTSAYCSNAV
uniref:Uncharacterized protein n=1 Tax=Panagrolaimus davidi TaxID=227884 RepID=A0A914QZA1_9BILA